MKIRASIFLIAAVLLLTSGMVSQTISVTVNGVQTGATIPSGDMLSWQITLPSGGISTNELWVDVNQNGVVNEGTDRLVYQFLQQDGMNNNDGPPDDDGTANGTITSQFPAGLAPAKWLFVVKLDGASDTSAFQILPLVSPTATISGHISAPVGVDRSYIVVQAESQASGDNMKPFWHALTNASGDYTIQMGPNATTQNPWRVSIQSSMLGRLIADRPDTNVSVGGTPPVVNFNLILGTVLMGTVYDQLEAPLPGANAHVHLAAFYEGSGNVGATTDMNGKYSFVVPPGNWVLHFTHEGYRDVWWQDKSNSGVADVLVITTQDTVKNLSAMLEKTGEIRGTVRNYGMPTSATVYLFTMPGEMGMMSRSTNDDGSFSFNVDPGTYYVKFEKDGEIQYYDHTYSSPGMAITITGTETHSGIDGDFEIGMPPNLPKPQILQVWDVPFDNGKQIYVKFRGIEQALEGLGVSEGDIPFGIEKYTIWRMDKIGLVYAGTVPAAWDSIYTGIVPTIVDSTITDGMRWSRFIVKAHFMFNMYIFASVVDSGYSLDNLAPGVPGGVGATIAGSDVMVAWSPNPDEDFRYFSVYRSTTQDFSTVGLTPVARTANLSYTDIGAASGTFYYRITATDFAGNESKPSGSSKVTAVAGEGIVPAVFALGQNYPNPFNPTTNIVYDVPSDSYVRIEVFNTLGQRVAELVAGEVMAGRHSVRFDATGLPTGLYIARMAAGEFTATRKVNLVK